MAEVEVVGDEEMMEGVEDEEVAEVVEDQEMAENEESCESELEDDDYDLIEENLGVKVQRRKFKRLRRISSDSDDDAAGAEGEDREAIAQELFEGSDNEEERGEGAGLVDTRARDHYSSGSEEENSDSELNDFIVDDVLPVNKGKGQKRKPGLARRAVSDARTRDAQDIFGIDFDYQEFEKYEDADDSESQDEESYDDEEEPDQQTTLRKKSKKGKKPFYEVFEPLELERAGYTERDFKIRTTDVPERLQVREVRLEKAEDWELQEEAEWVFKKAKFVGVPKKYVPVPQPEQSDANWGQDWDSRTIVPGAATVVGGTALPSAPATTTNWDDDWEKESTVPAPQDRTTISASGGTFSGRVPLPPPTNINCDDDDWEPQTPAPAPMNAPNISQSRHPPPSNINCNDDDWDQQTAAPAPIDTPNISQSPPTNINGDDDWEEQTQQASAPTTSEVTPNNIPKAQLSKANWADENDWDELTKDSSATLLSQSEGTAVPSTSEETLGSSNAIPATDVSVVNNEAGGGGWDNDEWDKGTTVTGVDGRDFVDWKRPVIPPKRKPATPAAPLTLTATSTPSGIMPETEEWAEASWETRSTVTVQQTNTTPRPPLSLADSAPIIVPAPLPEDNNGAVVIPKIKSTLNFMKNHNFEVPFIAFYRQEHVIPELSLSDLWQIYWLDAQFTELKFGKDCLLKVFNKMKQYLTEKALYLESTVGEIEEDFRLITNDHLERVKCINSAEDLKDNAAYFRIHYGDRVDVMNAYFKLQQPQEEQTPVEFEKRSIYDFKRKGGGTYTKCFQMYFVPPLLCKMGTTSEKFAENLRDKYQRHEVEQWPVGPEEVAAEIINAKSLQSKPQQLLETVCFVMAVQIANEPLVRQCIRKEFFDRATISCFPTKQGQRDIDESHPCFTIKYLTNKPVKTLEGDQFLKLVMAEKERLLNITVGNTFDYFDEIKHLITRDEYSKTVQDWNDLREKCLLQALNNHLIPNLRKELREKLLKDCYEYVVERCGSKLHHWLKVGPMKVSYPEKEEIVWDTSQGLRIMSLTYDLVFDRNMVIAAVLRPDGEPDIRSYRRNEEPTDRLKLPNVLKPKCAEKDEDMELLKYYIRDMKPHAIVIAGESKEAIRFKQDVSQIIAQLVAEDAFPEIKVEIVDNGAAKVYACSKRSLIDLGSDYPTLLRQAISVGRRAQDPLLELAQLWNHDDDILSCRFHPLQDQVPKHRLKERLEIEFINRTCEVGVDINRTLNFPHTASVLQFVCGLGPRKASALLQNLRQNHGGKLENRAQLLTFNCMGPNVFLNCAGFLKIEIIGEPKTESFIEALDGTRVHPESYELARRMAVDALDYDESPASAVEEIMEDPDHVRKLNALAIEEYANVLKGDGSGDKLETLANIREELKEKYKDARPEYTSPEPDDLFNIITKETPETFHVGKLVSATVGYIIRSKSKLDENNQLEPIKNNATRKWQCPYCPKKDFLELADVWQHLDADVSNDGCPGPAVGVRVYLDNGLPGFIPIVKLSDKQAVIPEERVFPGQKIHCRLTRILVDRFSVECTSRSSDLQDERDEWKAKKDAHYDKEHEAHDLDKLKEEDERKKTQVKRQVYVKRVIVHPSFRNISFTEAEKLLETMAQGEVVVRPSSKGANRLTVTWKVAEGVSQHIDVREEGKASSFSLGQTLWIDDEEFEDIDEIIARHVAPMASHARDIISYKYYVDTLGGNRGRTEEYLLQLKRKNNNKIHYVLQASKDLPGKFMLSYLPRNTAVHEFVTVTTEGFRFRQQMFDNFEELMKWFKIHFKDPPPASTPIFSFTN